MRGSRNIANVVLVTGGSRGIGAAVCRKAAQHGYDVAINYSNNKAAAERVFQEVRDVGRRALLVQADVGNALEVKKMFAKVQEELGDIYGLVNNAGITGQTSSLVDADPSTIEEVVRVNVLGTMFCTREALRCMKGPGAIVNVTSGAATLGSANEYTWYAASKAAIDCFTYGTAQEVVAKGIRINGVAPGLTDTELHALSTGEPNKLERIMPIIPIGRAATADEIADPILYLLSREGASYVAGTVMRVAGGR